MLTLIFDTETSDLIGNSLLADRHMPHIIEFYGCIVNEEGDVVEELDVLCKPPQPISETTTRITGIKQEDVKDAPPFSHFAEKVFAMIESADTVVAHNLTYDMGVVNVEAKRLGREVAWPADRVCTVESSEFYKSHRLNLSALHELLFDEQFTGAHRARVDVEALTRCYLETVRRGDI